MNPDKRAMLFFILTLCCFFAGAKEAAAQRPAPPLRSTTTGLPRVDRLCPRGTAAVTITEQLWFDPSDPVLVRLARRAFGPYTGINARGVLDQLLRRNAQRCSASIPEDLQVHVEGEPEAPASPFGGMGSSSGMPLSQPCNTVIVTLTYHLRAQDWCPVTTPYPRRFPNFRAGITFYRDRARMTESQPARVYHTRGRFSPPASAVVPDRSIIEMGNLDTLSAPRTRPRRRRRP